MNRQNLSRLTVTIITRLSIMVVTCPFQPLQGAKVAPPTKLATQTTIVEIKESKAETLANAIIKASVLGGKKAPAKGEEFLTATAAILLGNNEAESDTAYKIFNKFLAANLAYADPIIIKTASLGLNNKNPKTRNHALNLFKALFTKNQGFAEAQNAIDHINHAEKDALTYARKTAAALQKALDATKEKLSAATKDAAEKQLNTDELKTIFANALETIKKNKDLARRFVNSNEALTNMLVQSFPQEVLSKDDLISLWRASKTMYIEPLTAACVIKLTSRLIATDPKLASINPALMSDEQHKGYLARIYNRISSWLKPKPQIPQGLHTSIYKEAIQIAAKGAINKNDQTRQTAFKLFNSLVVYNQGIEQAIAAASSGINDSNQQVQAETAILLTTLAEKTLDPKPTIKLASTCVLHPNNAAIQRAGIALFESLFKRKIGYTEAYHVINRINSVTPRNQTDERIRLLQQALAKTASEKEMATAQAFAFLTTTEQLKFFNKIVHDHASATAQQLSKLLEQYRAQLIMRKTQDNSIKNSFISFWEAAQAMHLEPLAAACAKTLALIEIDTESKQSTLNALGKKVASFFSAAPSDPLDIAIAQAKKEIVEQKTKAEPRESKSAKKSAPPSQKKINEEITVFNDTKAEMAQRSEALAFLKDALFKNYASVDAAIKNKIIEAATQTAMLPKTRVLGLALFEALINSNLGFDNAADAASTALKNATETRSASVSATTAYANYHIREKAFTVFNALFEKNKGFDTAFQTAAACTLSDDPSIQQSGLRLFEMLFKRKLGYTAAYRIINQINNPKDSRTKALNKLLDNTALATEKNIAREKAKRFTTEQQRAVFNAATKLIINTKKETPTISNEALAIKIDLDILTPNTLSSDDLISLWNKAKSEKIPQLATACARHLAILTIADEKSRGFFNGIYHTVTNWISPTYSEELQTAIDTEKQKIQQETAKSAKTASPLKIAQPKMPTPSKAFDTKAAA